MTSVGEIEAALASEDPELRRRGAQRIPEMASSERARLLVLALGDDDWRVRKEAVAISLELGASEQLITKLVDALRPGENVGLRNAAVETLAGLGASIVPALSASLSELDADGRKLAAEALGRARDASALPVLEHLVSDSDPNVRVAALDHVAEAAGFERERALKVLLSALGDDDVHVKLAALGGLSDLQASVPWELLEPLIEDPILRPAALLLAGKSDDERAALALSQALDDERSSIFAVALAGLAELVLQKRASIPALGPMLSTMSSSARQRLLAELRAEDDGEAHRAALVIAAIAHEEEAIEPVLDAFLGERSCLEAEVALRIFGPQALPHILSRIRGGRDEARASLISLAVSQSLRETDALRVCSALRLTVQDENPSVAAASLLALATLGDASDLSTIAALVSSSEPRVALAAEAALASLAVRHRRAALSIARDAIDDERSFLAASVIIGAMGGGLLGSIEDDLAFLGRVLESADARARRAAIVAVADLGSPLGLELATRALDDPAAPVRLEAVLALGHLRSEGRPVARDKLVELLSSDDPEVVVLALRALGLAGDPGVVPLLASLAASPQPAIAVEAISALGRIDSAAALPALLDAGSSSEAEVVKAALLALEGSTDPRTLALLDRALEHPSWDVRALAADCLGPSGGGRALSLLRERLPREAEPLVREAVERAIVAAAAREKAPSP